ncbi:tRNA (adenine(22)-N(1))-methyltransferase TrmK [uncultured Shewanella sp.]|uniref:tRNA (adenine(22)-N(1))-methyltransferase TrmK n=1 Tax=Shewanella atlantica TaxID=271099 RepID=UPI002621E756|nr:tRNA (adenine(22)-N(1))-methyltransferase TrmK [uncultured Shewanella sp.]
MKISQRLSQIDKMVNSHYDHIWDCCCDHGLLGARLLQRGAAGTIHFVDVVEELMVEVEKKLSRFFPSHQFNESTEPADEIQPSHWQVHCIDVAHLPLCDYEDGESHLIIIAGVGGELLIELIDAIMANSPNRHLEFILCPVHHNYKLRQHLAKMKLGLLDECLIQENRRFYEVMHLSTASEHPIVNVGSIMWNLSQDADKQYLHKTILHYQRMQKNAGTDTEMLRQIVDDYRDLEKQIK